VSSLHVRQVAAAVEREFGPHLDLSDVVAANRSDCLLSRGLAALAVRIVTGRDAESAATTVVDGFDDNGIDAICVEESQPRIVLVQAKWRRNGKGNIDLGDTLKFIEGLRLLIYEERFDQFNAKVQRFAAQISAALHDPRLRIVAAVVTTGESTLGLAPQQKLDNLRAEMNDPTEQFEVRVFGLAEVHRFLADGASPGVDLDLVLTNWGRVEEPYRAFYGVACAADIADWYATHGDRLFDGNIRRALGGTAANRSLVATLHNDPGHFWYFNNGITMLCKEVTKAPAGGAKREFGQFALQGVTVVNGAQTVASIAEAVRDGRRSVEQAHVWVRVIALTDCPPGFGAQVTRATNTQNTVEARDFVALDELQGALRQDFALRLGKRYAVKRGGEEEPTGAEGCSVVEAADALACTHGDPAYAVVAKRERGLLLEIGGQYYPRLFTRELTAVDVWRRVLVLRAVDAELAEQQRAREGRAKAVAVHGNRLVAHLVFAELGPVAVRDEDGWAGRLAAVPPLTRHLLDRLTEQVEAMFPDSYLASLFKNTTKCRQLVTAVRGMLATAA
jgi:hypothetical protein